MSRTESASDTGQYDAPTEVILDQLEYVAQTYRLIELLREVAPDEMDELAQDTRDDVATSTGDTLQKMMGFEGLLGGIAALLPLYAQVGSRLDPVMLRHKTVVKLMYLTAFRCRNLLQTTLLPGETEMLL